MAGEPPLKLLFIGGYGRSGSTLLDNLLGQLPGFFSAGEVQYIWDRSLLEDRLCSCNLPFSECEVWRQVRAECLEHLGERELRGFAETRESLTPRRVMGAALSGKPLRSPELVRYTETLRRIYESVSRVTGCRVIVDSSKSPGHGYLLRHLEGTEASALHLIRDSRAVAFSWLKKKVYDPTGETPLLMTRLSPRATCRNWSLWNVATEVVWGRSGRFLRLRYEDFIDAPGRALNAVLDLLGEPRAALPLVGDGQVEMGPLHAMAGNPSRFHGGTVELRRDDAWKSELNASTRRLVSVLTWPLLLRYGYLS